MVTISYLLMTLLMFSGLFLIGLILLQRGRGGGLAGAFGGMGGQSAFGTKAGDVFTRITIGVATAWILLCAGSVVALHHSTELRVDNSIFTNKDKDKEAGAADPLNKAKPAGDEAADDVAPDAPAPNAASVVPADPKPEAEKKPEQPAAKPVEGDSKPATPAQPAGDAKPQEGDGAGNKPDAPKGDEAKPDAPKVDEAKTDASPAKPE